jgi:hypothetical protein
MKLIRQPKKMSFRVVSITNRNCIISAGLIRLKAVACSRYSGMNSRMDYMHREVQCSYKIHLSPSTLEAGYKFPDQKNFEWNVFVSKFFYKDQSTLVQSALQAQTGVNLTYKNKYVNINGGADLKFSDQTDIGVTAGIDHLFVQKINGWKNSALAILPSATMYAGTQNFTTTHTKRSNFLGLPVTEEKTEQVKKFDILAYEFSAPVVLVSGKLNAYVIPSYVIPQNLVITETGQNLFYVTVGLGFRL